MPLGVYFLLVFRAKYARQQFYKEQVLIDLSNNDRLDISDLSEENQQMIQLKAQEAKLELKKKAGEALLDIQGTKANLDTFNQTVQDGTEAGTHVTLTHTQLHRRVARKW